MVAAHRLQAVSAGLPKAVEVRGFAQVVRHESEQRLGTLVPEFLGSFHTAVDLLDRRLNVAGGSNSTATDNGLMMLLLFSLI